MCCEGCSTDIRSAQISHLPITLLARIWIPYNEKQHILRWVRSPTSPRHNSKMFTDISDGVNAIRLVTNTDSPMISETTGVGSTNMLRTPAEQSNATEIL
ncbi:hypothetical protein Y032_0006g3064 [Ancylostoma ceylanicum]|uniref:Uncharacterized protein n=1 Tax=Ancylostoma ceylanicum TaxID=53326 RepID=A0A016VS82_9BILA|nr:hypothetical protein Y032_0006g3064 [Ancylostoma ceylanicum]